MSFGVCSNYFVIGCKDTLGYQTGTPLGLDLLGVVSVERSKNRADDGGWFTTSTTILVLILIETGQINRGPDLHDVSCKFGVQCHIITAHTQKQE